MEFFEKLQASIEKNGTKIAEYINQSEYNREKMQNENREKLKKLEIKYNTIKIYKKFWLIYFVLIFLSTLILVPFVETIPLIIGFIITATIGGIGTFIENNKEEKQKLLLDEIRNIKSRIMWEPNEELAKECAKRNVEFILGSQTYTLPQLEKEENNIIEENQKEILDKKIGTETEKLKTYDLKMGIGSNKK